MVDIIDMLIHMMTHGDSLVSKERYYVNFPGHIVNIEMAIQN